MGYLHAHALAITVVSGRSDGNFNGDSSGGDDGLVSDGVVDGGDSGATATKTTATDCKQQQQQLEINNGRKAS